MFDFWFGNFLRNYFFCKMKGSLMKNAWISKFFLDFLFALIKTIYAHFIFYTFQSPFFSAVFWAPIFLVYQAISLCIKYIASVMIRCASAHTHKLQNFYFFFPSLSISFQLLTNGIDQKSLPIFRSPSWEPSDILSENNFAKRQVLT